LIDRFTDSTIAYQHYGMGVDLNIINIINKFLLKNIKTSFSKIAKKKMRSKGGSHYEPLYQS